MSATATAETDLETRSRRPLALVLIALLLVAFCSSFESTMMFTALPTITAEFKSTTEDVSWVLTGYLLVGAASAAIAGRLGDMFGRKRMLLILLAASIVGSIISLVSPSVGGVIAGRAIQGVAGGLLPLAFGIIRENVKERHLSVSVSVVAGAAMLAGAAGNIIAGNVVDTLGWRYIFVIAIALAVVAFIFSLFLASVRRTAERDRIDWLGAILFAPGIAAILFGVNASSGLGWASGTVWGFIGVGVIILIFWLIWEARRKAPMINVRLFKQRNLGFTFLAAIFMTVPLGAAGYLGQLIMQYPTQAPVGFGVSAGLAGTISFCIGLFGFALSPLSGRISHGGRGKVSLIIGGVAGILAAVAVIFSIAVFHSLAFFIGSQVILTISTAFMLSSLPTLIVQNSPEKNTSEATGVYTVIQTAFQGVGTSVSTAILASSTVAIGPLQAGTTNTYVTVFVLSAVLAALGVIAALFIGRSKNVADPDDALEVIQDATKSNPLTLPAQ